MPTYRLFGLRVRSTFPLPELEPAEVGEPDVVIPHGQVAAPATTASAPIVLQLAGGAAVLTVAGVARYRIDGGRAITVDAQPGFAGRNLRLFLLGSAFGVLLHQRGILPLHANAVDLGSWAIAFMGHSGAGKSTLAEALARRGKAVLSDDVCAIAWREDGVACALPGLQRLRLWRDALENSGRSAAGYERAFDALEKYTVPLGSQAAGPVVPLGCIYLLRVSDGPELALRRLAPAEAAAALIANTYRGEYVGPLGTGEAHFAACLRLARSVPVVEFRRPMQIDRIDDQLGKLLGEAADPAFASAISAR